MNSKCSAFAFCIGAWLLITQASNAAEVIPLVKTCEQDSGEQAIAACGAIIASGKFTGNDLGTAYYRLATLHAQAGKIDLAITGYTAAIGLRPDFVDAFSDRGLAYSSLGKNDLALSDFSSEIRMAPKMARDYALRATVYTSTKQYEKAFADLDRAISLMARNSPQLAFTFALRGMTNESLHRHEAAEADLGKALSMAKQNPMLLDEACWVRAASGRHLAKALELCNQALQLMPNDIGYRDTRALVYLRLGRLVDARNEYDAVLTARPNYAHALFGRGITKIRSGDKAGGQADIAGAAKIDPQMTHEFEGYGIKP